MLGYAHIHCKEGKAYCDTGHREATGSNFSYSGYCESWRDTNAGDETRERQEIQSSEDVREDTNCYILAGSASGHISRMIAYQEPL